MMRRALLDLLGEMPLEAITGAMIAERAKVGYATYFRHYADVADLLGDTVGNLAGTLAEQMMPALLAGDTSGAALALVQAVEQQRVVYLALLNGAGDAARGVLTRHIVDRMTQLPDLSPAWLPSRLATRFAVVGTIEVLDWWLREEPLRTPAEVAFIVDHLVIARLSAPATAIG